MSWKRTIGGCASQTSLIDTAKKLVQELWDSEYWHLSVSSVHSVLLDVKRRTVFHTKFNENREESSQAPLPSQLALEEWQRLCLDSDQYVVDPLAHWHEKRNLCPRLAQIALDGLSIATMSTDVIN
ncbi:uncharacterized protein V1513DRAFT_447814 [Lipomyces chichibuensis]|uniref:uncharacterized protein n=1 Tax=Lipomyces chichibuensis TaxID=1546026 RepID=UPI003343D2E2